MPALHQVHCTAYIVLRALHCVQVQLVDSPGFHVLPVLSQLIF
jgi:hypothetical protein